LLFGDLAVFATLFSIYSFHRAGEKEIFAQSQQHLNRALGGTNTIVLLTSSLMLAFAARAIRRNELRKLAAPLVIGTIGLGLCFVGLKFVEYHSLLSKGFTPQRISSSCITSF
jgi:nitric oxide reductase NorE protein